MNAYSAGLNNVYIIGCGGVASWLLPLMVKLLSNQSPPPCITLVDGDRLEKRNLDRQLFNLDHVGKPKAEMLVTKYKDQYPRLVAINEFLMDGSLQPEPGSLFFGCADNHAARRMVLSLVDQWGGKAIIGGNEYTDSEAYIYDPEWRGTHLDPRVYYPEILTDTTGDPTRPVSCQGEATVAHPQLAWANFSAANAMVGLFWFYYVERQKLSRADTYHVWPVRHSNTFSRFTTQLIGKETIT